MPSPEGSHAPGSSGWSAAFVWACSSVSLPSNSAANSKLADNGNASTSERGWESLGTTFVIEWPWRVHRPLNHHGRVEGVGLVTGRKEILVSTYSGRLGKPITLGEISTITTPPQTNPDAVRPPSSVVCASSMSVSLAGLGEPTLPEAAYDKGPRRKSSSTTPEAPSPTTTMSGGRRIHAGAAAPLPVGSASPGLPGWTASETTGPLQRARRMGDACEIAEVALLATARQLVQ